MLIFKQVTWLFICKSAHHRAVSCHCEQMKSSIQDKPQKLKEQLQKDQKFDDSRNMLMDGLHVL
jgi:hypothetical protein